MTYHHGVEVKETTKLTTLIRDINTSVIGVVCTGDDADAEQFPFDTPVLVTRIRSVLGKAGKTGTLYKTLKAISDQCNPKRARWPKLRINLLSAVIVPTAAGHNSRI